MKCPDLYCLNCGDRMIHHGGRKSDESASPFGQWIHDSLQRWFTSGDVDQYVRRSFPNGPTLLRWIEHKSPGQKFEGPQRESLRDFDALIRHAVDCPTSPIAVREGSGVYVVRSGFMDGQPVGVLVERQHDGKLWNPGKDKNGDELPLDVALDAFARWLIQSSGSPIKPVRRAA